MNQTEFINYLKTLNITLTSEQLKSLEIYLEYLKEYNSHTNITAIKEDNDIYLKHFLDSILLTNTNLIKDNISILDIGSGAGFPGMVIKILFPNIKLTLLDSNNKKTTFLTNLANKLKLDNVEVVNDRAENYIKTNREKFDIVTSRAVASLNVLSELSMPFVKVGEYFLPMKGNLEQELEKSTSAIEILGGSITSKLDYTLPIENSTRTILIVEKVKPTPVLYPRLYDKIIKKPL